ncbi:MAG TPA: glycosyltransferase, partial [Fibrobacteria bacterium]|nr:glycosyltransferase [Fibrobacteria bacterium]
AGLVQGSPGIDSPWLTARAAELSAQTPAADASWTPTPPAGERRKWDEAIKNYPESLGPAMRSAKDIAFAGSIADMLPESGAFHVLDMEGARVPFLDQDLVILRLTPDMVDGLEARLRNLRRRGRSLRRLLVVMNSAQALRRPLPEGVLLAQPDVTPEGARAALWGSGFAVLSEKPYHGFPPVPGAVINFDGWTLLEAAPRTADAVLAKKVSIVILGFNQVEYTRKCIESIRAHTRQEYELILVDNGSKDGTEAFFRSIPEAKVIRNEENLGVSRGWNQGMRRAEGDYILIFNNDTIVGPGWLEHMVRLCESDPGIGMVGPRSNYIAGPQVVKDVPYKTEAGIQDFIRDWQMEHDLSASEFDWIKGFCLLIPRGVFAKVGYFDERFGKGNFEDDDYCLRVRLHGFRTMIAHDAFIHHYGSVSFNQEDVDWKALMIENRRKYEEKWARGAAALAETQVAEPTPEAPASPAGTSRTPASPASRPAAPDLSAADRAYTSGDIAAARRLYLEAQAARPDHPDPLCGLGVLAFHDGAHLDAGTLFLKCLEMDPTHRDAAGNLIDILKDLEGSLLLP